jgi:hypothetical protein
VSPGRGLPLGCHISHGHSTTSSRVVFGHPRSACHTRENSHFGLSADGLANLFRCARRPTASMTRLEHPPKAVRQRGFAVLPPRLCGLSRATLGYLFQVF